MIDRATGVVESAGNECVETLRMGGTCCFRLGQALRRMVGVCHAPLDDAIGRGYWRLLSLRIFKRAVHNRFRNLQHINLSLLKVTSIVIKWFARCK